MKTVQLNPISEMEFAASEPSRRLITHEHARRFGRLTVAGGSSVFAVSWRSQLIEPTIVVDECGPVVWVGVDDRVVAVTFDGQIQFSTSLQSPLLAILQSSCGIVVVCELAAMVINRDFSLRSVVEFREIPMRYDLQNNRLRVVFIDSTTDEFEL